MTITRLARLVATLAILAASSVVSGQPAQAGSETAYNVWVWNISGWKMNRGSTTNGMTETAVASILNRKSDLVAFNEMCWSQYVDIKRRLEAEGWPDDPSNFSRFRSHGQRTCNGGDFGVAVFSKRPLGTARGTVLPDDGTGYRRVLLCAPLVNSKLTFCTTHISYLGTNNGTAKNAQINAVRKRLEQYYKEGRQVVIAGDFNVQPNYAILNDWYSSTANSKNNPNNKGAYREVDQTDTRCPGYGERTVEDAGGICKSGSKIDFIFARENSFRAVDNGNSLNVSNGCGGGCSDHRILIGRVITK